jgi:tetratricopeptide (TPR) repeat protein
MEVDAKKARQASLRATIELARLEMKSKNFMESERILTDALATAKDKCGNESPEAASVMASLASCFRQNGELGRAVEYFEKLYDINVKQSENGAVNESSVMLATTLSQVLAEAERYGEAAKWAETALEVMQKAIGVKVHPLLQQYFDTVVDLKIKAGDPAGAEEVRKSFLKGKAQLQQKAARAGAGGPAGGQGKKDKKGAAGKAGGKGRK